MKTDNTDKMKAANEILKSNGLPVSTFHSIKGSYSTLDAMQDHTDQAIAEYKMKLKEAISGRHAIFTGDMIELIGTTTI